MIKYDSRRLLETVTSVFKVVQHSLNACNGPEMADPQSGGELVGSRKSSRQGHSVSEHPTEQSSSHLEHFLNFCQHVITVSSLCHH